MAKIVVVDDSQYIAKSIRDYLETKGHEVVALGNDGETGVKLYKEHQPDLIMLDITMPNKDGRDCLSDIIEINSSANVLMVSAVKDASIIMDCLQAGAKGFVEKPLRWRNPDFCAEFETAINDALN